MKNWLKYIHYVTLLPTDLIGWLVCLFVGTVWGKGVPKFKDGVLVAIMRTDSWPAKTWFKNWGGFTIGHSMVLKETSMDTFYHEMKHVRQNEANSLVGLFLLLVVIPSSVATSIILWVVSPWTVYLGGMLSAVLHGSDAYRNNHLEEAAYDAEAARPPK